MRRVVLIGLLACGSAASTLAQPAASASLVPLALYFLSGRWFVRGIAAGAVKG